MRTDTGEAYLAVRGPHVRISASTFGVDLVRANGPDGGGAMCHFAFVNGQPRRTTVRALYQYLRGLDDARCDLGAPRLARVVVDGAGTAHRIFAGTGGGIIDEIVDRLQIDGDASGPAMAA